MREAILSNTKTIMKVITTLVCMRCRYDLTDDKTDFVDTTVL